MTQSSHYGKSSCSDNLQLQIPILHLAPPGILTRAVRTGEDSAVATHFVIKDDLNTLMNGPTRKASDGTVSFTLTFFYIFVAGIVCVGGSKEGVKRGRP